MIRVIFLLLFILFKPLFLCAQQGMIPHIVCGPYLQAVGENEFTLHFVSDIDAIASVEVAVDNDEPFESAQKNVIHENVWGRKPITNHHCIKVTDLNVGKIYRYRIVMQAAVSNMFEVTKFGQLMKDKVHKVKLLNRNKKKIFFAVTNDVHERIQDFRIMFKDAKEKEYDFVLFNGDMFHDINFENKFANILLNEATNIFASEIPLFMNRGNHEHRGNQATTYMNWFSTSSGRPYYSFTHGPLFFIVLDSGESRPDTLENTRDFMLSNQYRQEESEWLKEVLQSEACKSAAMRVVFSHIPFYNYPEWHGGKEMNRLMVPLLNEAKVDLAICADVHEYHFHEIGSFDCNFPILVNGNCELMEISADKNKIYILVYGPNGKKIHYVNAQ